MQDRTRANSLSLAARNVPLKISLVFLLATYALFLFGPVSWPVENPAQTTLYVLTAYGLFAIAYHYSTFGTPRGDRLRSWRLIFLVGTISSVVLLFPSAYVYTGRWPWEVLDAWQDQREAYNSLQEQLALTEGQRAPIALLRALLSPFGMAALPLGVIYWRRMSWILRLLLGASIVSLFIFSVLRGTSRQLADIVVLLGSGALVAIWRPLPDGDQLRNRLRGVHLVWAVAGLCLTAFFFNLFVARVSARYSESPELCLFESAICADFDSPSVALLDPGNKYAVAATTLYLAQGYYGLSLALQKDFQTAWGLGHSAALMSLYIAQTEDPSLYERTFTFRLRENYWSDLYQWSTALVWYANDVGFFGALIVMAIFGRVLALTWLDATAGGDDRAAIVFALCMVQIFFFTSSTQLLQTFDGYSAVAGWTAAWLYFRNRRSRVRAA